MEGHLISTEHIKEAEIRIERRKLSSGLLRRVALQRIDVSSQRDSVASYF
jgi:hypothetical protein